MPSTRSGESIRQLRAKFEQRPQPATIRSQSPLTDTTGNPSTQRRKIRTSFISVDLYQPSKMATSAKANPDPEDGPPSPSKQRRPSFSFTDENDRESIDDLKRTISNEAERRGSIPSLKDNIVPEQALTSSLPTPIPELDESFSPLDSQKHVAPKPSNGSANIPGTDGQMEKDPLDVRQSSTNDTNPAAARSAAPAPKSSRVSNVVSSASKGQRPSLGRPPAKPSQTQAKASAGSVSPPGKTRPVPQHLLAPTASSAAKHESKPEVKKHPSSLKPIPVSSHLMAPTAASKARQESEPTTSQSGSMAPPKPTTTVKKDRSSIGSNFGASTSRRPASRTSLAGPSNPPNSHAQETAPKAPSSAFLDRMSKPTSASSARVHDKTEVKKPQVAPTAAKPAKKEATPVAKPAVKTPVVAPNQAATSQTSKSAPSTKPVAKTATATSAKPGGAKSVEANDAPEKAKTAAPPKTIAASKGGPPTAKQTSMASASKSSQPEAATKPSVSSETSKEVQPVDDAPPVSAAKAPANDVAPESIKTNGAPPQSASQTAVTPVSPAPDATKTTSAARAEAASLPNRDALPKPETAASSQKAKVQQTEVVWNAASLPNTPQRSAESNNIAQTSKAEAELPVTPEPKADEIKKQDRIAARKSMMETPDLDGPTIH